MPIPLNASQVPGQPNRIQLADGSIVTRASALTLGAQEMGYRSHNDYRRNLFGNRNYINAWSRTTQGQHAIQLEKFLAKSEGRRFRMDTLGQRLIAARNQKPTKSRPAGPAFVEFLEVYVLDDDADHDFY